MADTTFLDRVREAVRTFRSESSDDEKIAAAAVLSDACEEAGLPVDAAWFGWVARGRRREDEPSSAIGCQIFGTAPEQLDTIVSRLRDR